ncbi:sensor histidine kinase [Paenibacillus planticolens]|uniref:HAMP domain-containing protein n=1 Tax=Paenibacillus planticolens TaxID=2654976 RepID=A0ABX1ZM55_9BACL|nr:sensor histidine kinase [Paenibacillus planticolens]NOV01026.1 HAMP domain-containing protein [Paenibacillus planticolens]
MPVFRSLKSTIIWLFIPITIVFVLVTGTISFMLASQQLKENAFTNLNDTIAQTKSLLSDKLTAFIAELIGLENKSEWISIMNKTDDPGVPLEPEDYIFMNKALDSYFERYPMLDSVLFYYNEGRVSQYKQNNSLISTVNISLDDYSSKLESERLSVIKWLNIHDENQLAAPQVISVYRMFGKDKSRTKGIFMMNLKNRFFSDLLNNAKISTNGYLCIVSNDGVMSFKNVEDRYEIDEVRLQEDLMNVDEPSGKINITNKHGEKMLIVYDTLSLNKWKVAAIVPERELYNKVNSIGLVIIMVMLLAIVAAALLSNIIAHIITKPLIKLTHTVNRIEDGNLPILYKAVPSNEIGVLSRGIQDMMLRIKNLLTEIKEEQEKKRSAELAVLQSQIKPHFLYNTLFSIKQLCEMEEHKDAAEMVAALSNFYRISINKGNEIIPISLEIEHIRNYLYIQQMRYGEDFIYEIDIEPDIMNCNIVKLTLQPLVENAIYHGMKLKRGQGLIRIWGEAANHEVRLYVEDNGKGMSEEEVKAINQSLREEADSGSIPGFGIGNINKRLQLNYGASFGLVYENRQSGGVTVMIRIPFYE